MRSSVYLARVTFRRRLRRIVALVVLVGLAAGLVLAVFAGARRTDTSVARYVAAERSADAYLDYGFVYQGAQPDLRRIEHLPEVVTWSHYRGSYVVLGRGRDGAPITPAESQDAVNFLGPIDGRIGTAVDRHRVVAGRVPAWNRPLEIMVDTKAARSLGVHVGSTLAVRFWKKRDAIGRWSLHDSPATTNSGPLVHLRVVGMEARVASLDWPGFVWMSPAFYRTYDRGSLMSWEDEVAFRLRGGQRALSGFRASVAAVAGTGGYELYGAQDANSDTIGAFALQAKALYLIALVGVFVFGLMIAQALARDAADAGAEASVLSALGLRRHELARLYAVRGAVVGAGAAGVAGVAAFLLSPVFPLGAAGAVEPDPGRQVSGAVIAGAAVVLVGVTLATTVAGLRATRRAGFRPSGSARSGLAERVAQLGGGPAVVAGVRMAFGRAPRAVSARSAIAGLTVATIAVVGALIFAASLRHLVGTPAAYGQAWDLEVGAGGAYTGGRDVSSLRHDPTVRRLMATHDVAALAVGAVAYTLVVGRHLVGVQSEDSLVGPPLWTVIGGRAPREAGEVMLAPHTMATTHSRVGGSVLVRHAGTTRRFRVVGEGVLVPNGFNGLGDGAAMTYQGLRRLVPDALPTVYRVRFDPGAHSLGTRGSVASANQVGLPGPPARISALADIARLPGAIVALALAVLVLVISHVLFTSVGVRCRELAILKTVGFSRSQILAAVLVQSLAVAVPAILLGTVLGVGAGRWAWRLAAEQLGVATAPSSAGVTLVLWVGIATLGAMLIALVPGRLAARAPAATALRAE